MIAVVIPCFRVKKHILSVLAAIPAAVDRIYVVDDRCPENTGAYVQENCPDSRIRVIFNQENRGVGGATIAGYRQALADGATIVVKVDGDNQMDPSLIPRFIRPIAEGKADYTKGNRFFELEGLSSMPKVRLFGNAGLSLISKMCSGYWDIMDPTNGFTAIHTTALRLLPLHKLDTRYFFESDLLFRLNTIRAVVQDIPMAAQYGDEKSNLNIVTVLMKFPGKYSLRLLKRLFYSYFLRDFNAGTILFLTGLTLLIGGSSYGAWHWYESYLTRLPATSGEVMLSALPILLGFQLLISAINYDITNTPKNCLHKLLDSHYP